MPGSTTLAFVVNSLPVVFGAFFGDLIPTRQQLMAGTTAWPERDLFD